MNILAKMNKKAAVQLSGGKIRRKTNKVNKKNPKK